MARKDVVKYTIPVAGSPIISLSASFVTPATVIKYLDSISYQINVTTTDSVGTFAVQVSNDFQQDEVNNIVVNPGTWTALTLSGTPSVSAANDSIVIDLQLMPYYATRIAYTSSSAGTGTAGIILNAKQIGG